MCDYQSWFIHLNKFKINQGSINKLTYQALASNQKFFRAGEVSWNQSTLINVLWKLTRKKAPQRKIWEFFYLAYSQNYTLNRKFNSKMDNIRIFFSKAREIFLLSKRAGEATPLKQPHEVFYKNGVLKNFCKIHRTTLVSESLF